MKTLWHTFWHHWVHDTFGHLWYRYFELEKPELGLIMMRAARFYSKLDMVLIPIGTIKGLELHLKNVTMPEYERLFACKNAAELSQMYLQITEDRNAKQI